MEENDGNMVRFRLVFDDRHLLDKSQRSQGLRRCWFLLKPDITNIGDLSSQIRESFGLSDRIVLFMDDFVLPSFESTCIITDKDIIRVKKKEAKQKDICKPCDGLNLLQDSENARVHDLAFNKKLLADGKSQENSQGNGSYDKEILTSCMENSVHLDPPSGDVGSAKQKRKHSKKLLGSKGQSDEISHENEFEPNNNSDVRKKKQARPQMVHHNYDGEEDVAPSVDRPGYIQFQPQEHGTQQADKTQVDGVPVSDGILPLPKPEVMFSAAVNVTKPPKHLIHFESLLPLRRLPVKGDILSYRYVEPSSSVYPELSSLQVGKVSSFDYKTLQIILLPVLDYGILLEDNPNGNIVQPSASRYKDGSLEIEYLSLVDVRLLKAHDFEEEEEEEEEACQDDQARKDNWEEALAKGNWNEPCASSAEQSNGWAQWIPNKSATAMSWSFKQPIAPLAGRSKGRANWAPNRGMNTCIPNRNTTNWNPNRNNTNWNPNGNNTRFNANVALPWSYRASRLPTQWEPHQNNIFLPGGKFTGSGKQ